MIRQDKLSTAQRVLSMATALALLLTLPHAVGAAPPLKLFDHNQTVQGEHDETQRQIDEMKRRLEITDSILCAMLTVLGGSGERTVFVTSTTYDGNLGGIAGADQKCNDRAAAADPPLTGNYKAWVSISDAPFGSVRNNFTKSPCPYVRTDGVPIDNSFADIVDFSGTLLNPINIDESGDPVGRINRVWTSTTAEAFWHNLNFDCNDWTSAAPEVPGIVGDAQATNFEWSFDGGGDAVLFCDMKAHLYCFQQ